MKKQGLIIIILVIFSIIVTVGVAAWLNMGPNLLKTRVDNNKIEESLPIPQEQEELPVADEATNADQMVVEDEEAETAGFQFILDFIEVGPPNMDKAAANRAYQALSNNAQLGMNQETLSRDLAMFVGVQDMPNQGISVENLVFTTDDNAILTVGLNYSGGRELRAITLIKENDEWKVDAVAPITEME